MKKHAVALLAPALLLGSQSYALPPDEPPDIELFISGSGAQDGALENLMRLKAGAEGTPNICQEGSLDIFEGIIDGTRKRVYYCLTGENVTGVPADRRLAVHKSSGGSPEGVVPVARSKQLKFMDLSNLSEDDACRAAKRILQTGDLAAFGLHKNCGGSSKQAAAHAGITDIEPALLGEDTTGLTMRSKAQLVWGLPVSKNFRNALQAIQGLIPADVAHDAEIRETPEKMPSLTSAQIASIFAGAVDSWSQLYDRAGNPIYLSPDLPVEAPDLPDMSGTSPGAYQPTDLGGQRVYVCRRTANTGAQAAYEIHYLKRRCLQDAPLFVAADDGSDHQNGGDPELLVRKPDPAGRVFAGKDTAAVRACLDAHDEYNRWAIGIFSTENIGNNLSNEFRHIRVDGYAPSLVNAHRGLWPHVSESTLQWRTADRGQLEISDEGRTLQFLKRNMGKARVLSALNASFEHPWGQGGYLAIPETAAETRSVPVTTESLRESPVAGVIQQDKSMRNCHVPFIRGSSSAAH